MSEPADDETDGGSPDRTVIPRLTISQRVLASLPNLQRTPAPPAKKAPAAPLAPQRRDDTAARTDNDAHAQVVSPDAVISSGSDRVTRPPRGAPSGMSKEELSQIIKRIDDRERVVVWTTAAMGVIVGIALAFLTLHLNPPVHAKNHESPSLIIFEGAIRPLLSGIVLLAAWNRRRSFVAFSVLLLGVSMGGLFALPFFGVGLWLIFRVLKWQKELAAMTGQTRARADVKSRPRPEPKARPRPSASTGGRADLVSRGRAGAEARRRARADKLAQARARRQGKKEPEPAGPPPSKRYTPPNQVRPRPPGTR